MTDAAKEFGPFEKDVWELYDMRNDFGLATDLSAEYHTSSRNSKNSSTAKRASTTSTR